MDNKKSQHPQGPSAPTADKIEEEDENTETAEEIRSNSQTAQDRDNVVRGGDAQTRPMKEFPT